MADPKLVRFVYTNHRGEKRLRQVVPGQLRFGTSPYHPGGPQWILYAYDAEKGAQREFSMKDIAEWAPYESTPCDD